jgi:hypothetical protein
LRTIRFLDAVVSPARLARVLSQIVGTRRELDLAGGPLRAVSIEQFTDDEDPPKLRWRAEFRRH